MFDQRTWDRNIAILRSSREDGYVLHEDMRLITECLQMLKDNQDKLKNNKRMGRREKPDRDLTKEPEEKKE